MCDAGSAPGHLGTTKTCQSGAWGSFAVLQTRGISQELVSCVLVGIGLFCFSSVACSLAVLADFPPLGQLLKQLSNAVLGGIFRSKLIEEKTQVLCCFVASFLKITKARLSSLLKKQEENSLHPKNWVLREASNLSALQEAGTFR